MTVRMLPLSLSLVLAAGIVSGNAAALPPGVQPEIDGVKAITLVNREPPGVRCNANMQVAAELNNVYRVPVNIVPQSLAGPAAKAPAVYYGEELITEDGDNNNGITSTAELGDVLDVMGAPRQDQEGRLMQIREIHDELKAAIREVE